MVRAVLLRLPLVTDCVGHCLRHGLLGLLAGALGGGEAAALGHVDGCTSLLCAEEYTLTVLPGVALSREGATSLWTCRCSHCVEVSVGDLLHALIRLLPVPTVLLLGPLLLAGSSAMLVYERLLLRLDGGIGLVAGAR